jgi:hypothetical protein
MKECAFLNGTYIPALIAYEYSGYVVSAWARPELTKGFTSVGIVYKRSQHGAMIQVQRIEGKLFGRREQAEQSGLELCKNWIDRHVDAIVEAQTSRNAGISIADLSNGKVATKR